MRRLVLASTSPWRRKMLEDAGLQVHCEAPRVDERAVQAATATALATTLAGQKADAVAVRCPSDWVLGADQVLSDGHTLFGKPADPADHLARLQAMRGRTHELVTAWALRGPGTPADGHALTRLTVRSDVEDAELRAYVASGEASGCAGGYAVEGRGVFLFERIEGDWFNVVGLPLLDVMGALRERGWRHGG